jgi:hypothetical protein
MGTAQAHQKFHNFLSKLGFGFGDKGREAWARLTQRQQKAILMRALRYAGVSNSVISQNIDKIMQCATPGVKTPRTCRASKGSVIMGVGPQAIVEILVNPGSLKRQSYQPDGGGTLEHLRPTSARNANVRISRPKSMNPVFITFSATDMS